MPSEERVLTTDSFLSKEDTLFLKGIAVLLMLAYHLWAFPERLPSELIGTFFFLNNDYLYWAAGFGKICISMFAFLGGYGKFKKYSGTKTNTLTDLKKLYIKYWKVFFIFVPIAFFLIGNHYTSCGVESVAASYSSFSVKELVLNIICARSSYNREWWFISNYTICILLFPLITKMVNKLSVITNIFIMTAFEVLCLYIDILVGYKEGTLYDNCLWFKSPFIVCFFMGVLFARHSLFTKAGNIIGRLKCKPVIYIVACLIVFYLKVQIDIVSMFDCIYAAIIIFVAKNLLGRMRVVYSVFSYLGKHSTNIWLTHTFFCYYFYATAAVITFFKWSVLALFVLVLFSLAASWLVDSFWNIILRIYRHIFSSNREA